MLTGIHFLLTYRCTFECDHCFLHCSPHTGGTFSIGQVMDVLDQCRKIGTIEWIYFEGGEPLLYYSLLEESIRLAREMGFKVGMVSNAYAARTEADAKLWLKPLADAGLTFINISNDLFHYGDTRENPATVAERVARRLGIETEPIRIEPPRVETARPEGSRKGQPVVGGDVMFRGRAAERLAEGLPRRPCHEFCECPYEDLESPERLHVDAFGTVQICQGISIGNLWDTPLSEIVDLYRAEDHPICGPLLNGGPFELARALNADADEGYIAECHMCYSIRKQTIDRFPEQLTPRQVYGLNP